MFWPSFVAYLFCLGYKSTFQRIAQLREFSHPDWLPRRGIERGIATLDLKARQALRDTALERQQNNNSKTIRNHDLLIMFSNPLSRSTKSSLFESGFLLAGSWQSWQLIQLEWLFSSARWILQHSHRLYETGVFFHLKRRLCDSKRKFISRLVNSTYVKFHLKNLYRTHRFAIRAISFLRVNFNVRGIPSSGSQFSYSTVRFLER